MKKLSDSGIRVECPGCNRLFKPSSVKNHMRMIHWIPEKAIERIYSDMKFLIATEKAKA